MSSTLQTLEKGQHVHNHGGWVPTIPKEFLWVDMKRSHPNDVLMIKVGAFYEMFHEDADILHDEFDCLYMKGEVAHNGFPASCLDKFKGGLESKGYTVRTVVCPMRSVSNQCSI